MALLGGLLMAAGWLAALPARPAETRQVVVGTSLESWYHVPPAAAPQGLPAASPFPEGNLHVGVTAGSESARSYLRLATAGLPGTIVGGALILPVLDDPAAGSLLPESASLRVCLAESPGEDGVEGGTPPLPPVDCGVSAPALLAEGDQPTFIADLTLFGDLPGTAGLAILPAAGVAPEATWRVVFQGQADLASGGVRARLEIASAEEDAPAPTNESPSFDLGSAAPDFGAQSFEPAPSFSLPTPTFEPAGPDLAIEPDLDSGPAPVAAAPIAFIPDGFSYPAVLLLPLALIAALGWFGSNLTRPALQPRKESL